MRIARSLNQIIKEARDLIKTMGVPQVELLLKDKIIEAGFTKVDYVTLRDAETLREILSRQDCDNIRVLVAAYLGSVRLIDNMAL